VEEAGRGAGSPDRADALVWAVTDLLIERAARLGPRVTVLDWGPGPAELLR
jgi:phage terminase large subunit-like protein